MQPVLISSHKIARAALLAMQQHSGKTRSDGTPYVIHLFRVAEYLRSCAGVSDENMLCAAYLHDTIEDTGTTYDDIAGAFGTETADLVAELTNDNRLPKALRRTAMIEHIPHLSPKAKCLKLADRLDNVSDLIRLGGTQEKIARYITETEQILAGCKDACAPLERLLEQTLQELKTQFVKM